MRCFRFAILLFYTLSAVAFGQTKSTVSKQLEMPSESGVRELLSASPLSITVKTESVSCLFGNGRSGDDGERLLECLQRILRTA
jgi:hypothetical protein